MPDMATIKELKYLDRWDKQFQTINESVLTKFGMRQVRTLFLLSYEFGQSISRDLQLLLIFRVTVMLVTSLCWWLLKLVTNTFGLQHPSPTSM